jgi:hypothetical protein
MFADFELDIIENVLEMCQGKVNRAAEVLLKMQEDEMEDGGKDSQSGKLDEDFLEIGDQKDFQERVDRDPRQVVLENENLEKEYLEEMQRAIELSLEQEKGKKGTARKLEVKNVGRNSKVLENREKLAQNIRKNEKSETKEKPQKIEKSHQKDQPKETDIQVSDPNEEVIQFIFPGKTFIRGETLA